MGKFAETAIIDNHLSFADQEKKNFRLQQYIYIYMENGTIKLYICCCFKRKMKAQAIFLNPFTI
jgi:hypothetical protein